MLKDELDKSFLSDAAQFEEESSDDQNDIGNTGEPKHLWISVFVSLVVLVGVSVGVYVKYGAYNDVVNTLDHKVLEQATSKAKEGDISDLLIQLHQKLLESPDNLEGWSLLARSAMNTERYKLAVESFENIVRILKEQEAAKVELAAAYGILAQAQYYVAQGAISSEVQATLDQALLLDPQELNTLSLIAIDSFTKARYEDAINNWQRILDINPEHPAKNSIVSGIKEAKKRMGQSVEESPIDPSSQAPSLSIKVDIHPSISTSVDPNTPVFIFVKNAETGSGPNVPLAASRHLVSDLPLTISLSDQNAMSPMAKLSDAETVVVTARVSLSGQPIAQSGDLQGEQANVSVNENGVISIVINDIVE